MQNDTAVLALSAMLEYRPQDAEKVRQRPRGRGA